MINVNDVSYFERTPDLEGNALRDHYKDTGSYKHVTPITINKWRKMSGMKAALESKFQRDINEISNEEIAKYIVANWLTKLKDKPKVPKETTTNYKPEDIDKRLTSYLEHYEVKTTNDMSSLRQLCVLEAAIEQLEMVEARLLKDINSKKDINETYINSIVNARLRYLTEYRQLQVMLGIDRVARDKAEGETGGADYMRGLMRSAKDLLDSKSVKIECRNCQAKGTVLQMGFVLCHFEGWTFSLKCPKCGEPITLSS